MIVYVQFLRYLISHLLFDCGYLLYIRFSWNMVIFELLDKIVIYTMESALGYDCLFWCMFGLGYLSVFSYLLICRHDVGVLDRGILRIG